MRGCRKDDMVLLQDKTMLADLWEWEANGRSTQEGTSLSQPVSTDRREAVALYFPTRFEATTMVCEGIPRQATVQFNFNDADRKDAKATALMRIGIRRCDVKKGAKRYYFNDDFNFVGSGSMITMQFQIPHVKVYADGDLTYTFKVPKKGAYRLFVELPQSMISAKFVDTPSQWNKTRWVSNEEKRRKRRFRNLTPPLKRLATWGKETPQPTADVEAYAAVCASASEFIRAIS